MPTHEYYMANREKMLAYQRKYYQEHKEEKHDYDVRWREEHHEYVVERKRKWAQEHPESARAWRQKNADRILRYNQERRLQNPLVHRAYVAVRKAILNGRLVPEPCEVCGESAEAHHDDYAKKLDVRWLCRIHHKEVHKSDGTLER